MSHYGYVEEESIYLIHFFSINYYLLGTRGDERKKETTLIKHNIYRL